MVGAKRDFERISLYIVLPGIRCCKSFELSSVKNKAATDGVGPSTHGGIRRRLFAQDIKDELYVTD